MSSTESPLSEPWMSDHTVVPGASGAHVPGGDSATASDAELQIDRPLPHARLTGARSDLAFRTLLDTTSRPGLIRRFVDPRFGGTPNVLFPVLALANVDTRVAVVDEAPTLDSANWLTLVCRATDAQPSTVHTADIVTVVGRLDPLLVSSLRLGTPEKPEHGARLVLACDALFVANELAPSDDDALAESGVSLALSGPGIDGQLRLVVEGVPAEAFERLAAVNAQPSCGIDVHLIEPGGRTVALPRSTRISVIRTDTAEPALSK